jgi:hypothetical protein
VKLFRTQSGPATAFVRIQTPKVLPTSVLARHFRTWLVAASLPCFAVGGPEQSAKGSPPPQTAVLHAEGLVHGFLVLCTLEGEALADGDMTQSARGDRVTNHLVFRFRDSSLHDETVVFSQHRNFHVITYHLLQKGPAFKHPMELALDGSTGQVTVRYLEEDGKEKTVTEVLKLPSDIVNGIVPILLKNIRTNLPQVAASIVAVTPKPRLVKLLISREGQDTFLIDSTSRKATRYVVKAELGGVAGVVAPIVGKQPPDTHIWIFEGDAPTFVKSEGPLFVGGPTWRIELIIPVWKNR